MNILESLEQSLPQDQFSTHPDQLAVVAQDESTLPPVTPIAVVWATNTKEVAHIVTLCNESSTPLTTRGAGSALEGSTIPSDNGIVLDLSRMTAMLDYWPEDLQVKVEPGLIYDHLNDKLKNDGLFFPPSPGGSGDIATIGGMVSTNASGIYSVKYGGTKEYILELEIVTADGQIRKVGNRAIKRSSGYNLVEIICGSEGTLAVITAITLKLAGLPEDKLQAAYIFPTELKAASAVSEICRYGIDVAAIEFLDRRVIEALNKLKDYSLKESPCLFLEFHGPKAAIESNAEMAQSICDELGGQPFDLADGQRPWEIRHWVTEAIKHRKPGFTIIRNDVAFPISKLPEMVEYCHQLADESGLLIHAFGHVGLGLLHALILADRNDSANWALGIEVNDKIIKKTISIGGTISGEHGIGIGHKNLFHLEHGNSIELMQGIKRVFDPKNILNPGKVFDL